MKNVNHEIHEKHEKNLVMMGSEVREFLGLKGMVG